ncbi:ATP-dependent helicase [Microbacterium sp. EYE_5]|uniref:ATP-dependent helicase n=1 Tax=unclassified Microbacterium TaxID=2609290 RepID=UPI0020068449|nr:MULTISPECIES: ATP-dependent helicase [unclassified Microbacterium]MCK6079918.1 ATP-dependent helicase [Microbacterium sp. EYE_382]MCK6085189.1 ATP-dependent helicase [Microbacterium sp. EYE_384]MCK6122585.1 ATP-dependent helicase [Microbacterium sp. EYE_80]MCK6125952.1 ATP-dependent helicase [Microbacterium sp. EYE_79]MCK6140873.1 ATP-dependent helicase [Microbacterium sp. EYE_39]
MADVLGRFSPATQDWFRGAFHAPTDAQAGAWQTISAGKHALVVAPTGSGKTLSAFLWALDRIFRDKVAERPAAAEQKPKKKRADATPPRTRVLYVSPLKALGVDVERNLRSPLVGIGQSARRLGMPAPDVTVGVRSGDTPSADRRRLLADPPDILITTPESLYLMLTSQAAETLRGIHTVIVDEVHAVAATKRGAHLAVSLERLDALLDTPAQRIGLSATVRPIDEVARFLGGAAPVDIVAPKASKAFDLSVVVPIDDLTNPPPPPGAPEEEEPVAVDADDDDDGDGGNWYTPPQSSEMTGSVWPHVEEAIVDRILAHRSTIVFSNSRRLAERLTGRLNEIYAERVGIEVPDQTVPAAMRVPAAEAPGGANAPSGGAVRAAQAGASAGVEAILAKAHHGSVSKEQRAQVEDELKSGALRCVVATSSLELGIDMGAVDLVIQVEAPPSAASGLQRVGRAGHQVGEVSRAALFPKHRGDVLHTAVVTERMLAGQIEAISVPQNPLDILAQHTIAASAVAVLDVEGWFETIKRSAPFRSLPRSAYEATLDLLAGRYPSDAFAELRPRVVWDRDAGTITGRPGAQRIAVTSGGTIPDRGLFGVFISGEARNARVGELDEEMVYESRVGDVFTLGTTSWRIVEITHDRVNVLPAYGQPGKLPFWHGDGLGRPAELGEALGKFSRELSTSKPEKATERLRESGLDDNAIGNLLAYIGEQREATGSLPTDKTLTVERSRDEVGDWRVILHSPYGMHVHAPWALAVNARIRERLGVEGAAVASDDGIIARVPDTDAEPPGAELFVFDADELEQVVTSEVGGSALFASRFRECAARALLLPRLNPNKRSPLWQQRQRSAQLLEVAKEHPTFPIILETLREVLQDVYDLPALLRITRSIADRRIRLVETTTSSPSPYARDLLFGYVGAFMYEGDSPLAERRAAALSVDPALLSELLGKIEMRELLDPGVIEQYERELQRLDPTRRVRGVEGVADLLRLLGPLSAAEVAERLEGAAPDDDAPAPAATEAVAAALLDELVDARRAIRVTFGGAARIAGIEDAGRLRDALGAALPVGIPTAFLEPVADPLADLVARYARTHGPFRTSDVATRLGVGGAVARQTLQRLEAQGRLASGFFLPTDSAHTDDLEWCDSEVLRRIRMRSLAAIRGSVEPVAPDALGRFLPVWQHLTRPLEGVDGVLAVVEQLAGVPLPASAWESLILPSRVRDYSPALLDELTATGEVVWSGHGSLPGRDGWIALHPADAASLTLQVPEDEPTPFEQSILDALGAGGAFFAGQLAGMIEAPNEQSVIDALWNLTWAGRVTNDTFAPVRGLLGGGSQAHRVTRRTPRTRMFRGTPIAAAARPAPQRPAMVGGRWSLLPLPSDDATLRATATAGLLLERYGVVTRGPVQSEGVPGGFAQVYRILAGFEDAGHCRRGYFVEKLGAAQFATSATVDRLREFASVPEPAPLTARTLAATDPANPYGAALNWPSIEGVNHRPGRKAGGLVVLVDGALVLYLERGGRTALAFTEADDVLAAAARSLVETARARKLDTLTIEQVSGAFVYTTAAGRALRDAGFVESPKGLTLRRGAREPARA